MNGVELVGILNITPDSFSDGGRYRPEDAEDRAYELSQQGANYIDVGAESTRPGAEPLSADEEWRRLSPFLPQLILDYPGRISVDTYHPQTVRRLGSTSRKFILNDVTTLNNLEMVEVTAEFGLRCIVSHLPQSSKQDIQAAHEQKPVSTIEQVTNELLAKRSQLISTGITHEQIILDPGIGFGKTMELNRQLLEFARFVPDSEVMIGYSRKRFLGKDRMDIEPNLEAGKIAIAAGAKYLRVHDVAGHVPLTRR